jgi:hypothetical protein
MTVTVNRHGETWEALMMSPNNIAYADCVAPWCGMPRC